MSQIFISAAHKSSGKTTLSIGLCAAFRNRGLSVAPFKKGPDYIDPLWLSLAAGQPCHNLDFHTSSESEVLGTLARYGASADICLIEGNKGLHDGMDLTGSNSNAALAKLAKAPVILVLDTRGTIRGIAPLLLGYQQFDTEVRIEGVILNQVGGSRHEAKLRAVVEHYTDIPVLGAVARSSDMELIERHLGLMPSNEDKNATGRIATIAQRIEDQVDLDALIATARLYPLPKIPAASTIANNPVADVRIGILRDAAFGFYYPGDLEAFATAGAEIVLIDSLHNRNLPNIDGLFIGGGFPETHMAQLQANSTLRAEIKSAIYAGLPTYAECGGLMYLSRSLSWHGKTCEMVGVLEADIAMHEKPQGRGYVWLVARSNALWPRDEHNSAERIPAHEFHYSAFTSIDPGWEYAYDVKRGQGIDGRVDGIQYRNLLASYSHLRNTEQNPWVRRYVAFVRSNKRQGRPG